MLNPHVHAVLLDGVYVEAGEEKPKFFALPLSTEDVADVLEDATGRMTRYLRRRGLLEEQEDGVAHLAPSAPSSDG
ncbi:MAG TPA: hypothetical protein VM925_01260 [Labilithrix sp.]|nr:hypothetical protein [Labilithrix sp.]